MAKKPRRQAFTPGDVIRLGGDVRAQNIFLVVSACRSARGQTDGGDTEWTKLLLMPSSSFQGPGLLARDCCPRNFVWIRSGRKL